MLEVAFEPLKATQFNHHQVQSHVATNSNVQIKHQVYFLVTVYFIAVLKGKVTFSLFVPF